MRKITQILIFLFSLYGFSQATLYVSETKPNIEVNCPNQVVGIYLSFFSLSYTNGIHNVNDSNIELNLSFVEQYQEPENCGGNCGNFENEFTNNENLDFFEYFTSDFQGPSPFTCPWVNYTNDYSNVPIWYSAVLIPDMTPSLELGVCKPIFDDYNGQVFDLTSIGAHWQYYNGSIWKLIPNFSGTFPLNKSILEIFGENYEDFIGIGETFPLRYTVFQGKYNSEEFIIDIKKCSPELLPNLTTKTNQTCFNSNDGGVTLTFDRNVDIINNYKMRYFIYQGDPSEFIATPDDPFPPQAYEDLILNELTDNGNTTYSGSSEQNLEQGDYYILYQEVKYEGNNVTVKSGELTPQFTIDNPTPVTIDGILTAAACDNDASIALLATGGNNLEQGGTYSYQYRVNNNISWQPATNPLTITPTNLQQTIYVRSAYTVNNKSCKSTEKPFIIAPSTPQLAIVGNPTFVSPTTNESTDGSIRIEVNNGIPNYTYELRKFNIYSDLFEVYEAIISPLKIIDFLNINIGTYKITVTDNNTCSQSSEDIIVTKAPVPNLIANPITQITCFNSADGEVSAQVSGFYPNYKYQWIINDNPSNIQTSASPLLTLDNLNIGGTYTLRVANGLINTDAEFLNPENHTQITFNLIVPNEVLISFASTNNISCFGGNDGSIILNHSGGTSYEYGFGNSPSNWFPLNGSTISNLSSGVYYITLKNENNCLSNTISTIIDEPSYPLTIQNISLINNTAYQANDGSINLMVSGGTADYSIEWTRLSDNTIISDKTSIYNLPADSYQISITDVNNCNLIDIFDITQPDIIEETIIPPTCTGGNNGSISIIVNKGNGDFSYNWSTGETSSTITNLIAGEYTLTITGSDEPLLRTYIVKDPLPITLNLGNDKVLCAGQELELDGTVENPNAYYTWTSDFGFSSFDPLVILSKKGNYTLTITTDKGCISSDSIFVDVSNEEISTELAVSSQVYVGETLILVDISYPLPESMEWIIPENARILKTNSDEAEIVFDTPGEYEIGIITQKGSCTEIQTKKVLVIANDPTIAKEDTDNSKKIVEDFLIYPNPNSGEFNIKVILSEKGDISIKIFSFINNVIIASENDKGESEYNIPFNISNMPVGVYAILLETPYGSSLRKIIIK